jgi:hypothetical protein
MLRTSLPSGIGVVFHFQDDRQRESLERFIASKGK